MDASRPDGRTNNSASVERALDMLRAHGHRITGARHAVIEVLAHLAGHPSAEQLAEEIRTRYPTVHRATVYRTLETLADLGVVREVQVGGRARAYHLADAGPEHEHLHASCRECGRIIDLPSDLLDPVARRLAREWEFDLDPPRLALAGICRACA